MLSMIIYKLSKAFPGKMDRISPPVEVSNMTDRQIKVMLLFVAP